MPSIALLVVAGAVLLCLGLRVYFQPRVGDRIGYWHNVLEGLEEPPDRFYARLYQALREGLQRPDLALSGFGFGPQPLYERRTILSGRPLYLCARYQHLTYYVYAGQTPAGLFVSSWFYNRYLIGDAGEANEPVPWRRWWQAARAWRYFARQTLFQHDAALMFQVSVHAILLRVIDTYTEEQGLRPLEEMERRPMLHRFYAQPLRALSLPGATASSRSMAPSPAVAPPVLTPSPVAPPAPATAPLRSSGFSSSRAERGAGRTLKSQPDDSPPLPEQEAFSPSTSAEEQGPEKDSAQEGELQRNGTQEEVSVEAVELEDGDVEVASEEAAA